MRLEDYCSNITLMSYEHRENAERLLAVLNPIEDFYIEQGGKPWVITSGYRFTSDHVRIYAEINAKRKAQKKKPLPVPMNSNHLKGNAVDISDPKQDLKIFVADHLHLFEEAELYFEAFQYTSSWLHIQRVPPKSGKRFYVPY